MRVPGAVIAGSRTQIRPTYNIEFDISSFLLGFLYLWGVNTNAMKLASVILMAAPLLMAACGTPNRTPAPKASSQEVAAFDADSAYAYVARQVAFGPRVPKSEAHGQCAKWLESELKRHGADTVIRQEAIADDNQGGTIPVVNIMGRYNTTAAKRILLLAHWDTRPVADNDPDPAKRGIAINGANDGASGVGVLLEIARQLGQKAPSVGVDILLCDAEDSGTHDNDDSWAIGTRYWTEHMPYDKGVLPAYGILLDMVGGRDAKFHREYFSQRDARGIVDKVWATATLVGESDRFVNAVGGAVTDDHVPVNEAGIPCIDIIECYNPQSGSFNPTWHTTADNMDNIDAATLRAAGATVINVIYNERP